MDDLSPDDLPALHGRRARGLAVLLAAVVLVGFVVAVVEIVKAIRSTSSSVSSVLAPSGKAKLNAMLALPRPNGAVEIASSSATGSFEYQPDASVEFRLPSTPANLCIAVLGTYERAGLQILDTGLTTTSTPEIDCLSATAFRGPLQPEVCTGPQAGECYSITLIGPDSYRLTYPP